MAANRKAASSGDHLAALEALRDTLAMALDGDNPNVYAQTAAQYRATLNEIAEIIKAQAVEDEDANVSPDTPDEAY
jgi:hypothetical protein